MNDMEQYLISKIFTVPYFDKMISENKIPDSFTKVVKRYMEDENLTYGKAISEIYEYMSQDYRNEYYYKNTVFNELLIKKHDLYNTAALTELPIGKSKADFIMINGKGVVYEIKTDLDNLLRLESQINDYYKVFSYVNVVVGKKQLLKVKEFLNESKVGIYELTESGKLISRKKAEYNRSDLSYSDMFNLLRKNEFENIIAEHFGKVPTVNSFEYYRECESWLEKINIITLQKYVMKYLKKRTLLTVEEIFEESIPHEMKFYMYFSKKYRFKHEDVARFLDKKVEV